MKNWIFCLLTVFLFACNHKPEESASENVLPKEKFIAVLIDMYMLEGKYSSANLIDKKAFEKRVDEYETIFKKHHTDKKAVEESFDYYAKQPEKMNEIFAVVLDSLNLRSNPK